MLLLSCRARNRANDLRFIVHRPPERSLIPGSTRAALTVYPLSNHVVPHNRHCEKS